MFLEFPTSINFDPYAESPKSLLTKTDRDLTLYVRADGDDSHDGYSEDDALATIQKAVGKIPDFIVHRLIIDVGEGEFKGFDVSSKIINTLSGELIIRGTLGNPVLSSGSVEGTATGGDRFSLSDFSQSWKEDELKGRLVKLENDYRIVRSNSATQIILAHPFGYSSNGKNYELFEQKTVVDGQSSLWGGVATITVTNLMHMRHSFTLQDFRIEGGNNMLGLYAGYTDGGIYERLHSVGAEIGLGFQSIVKEMLPAELYGENASEFNIGFTKISGAIRFGRIAANKGGSVNYGSIIMFNCHCLQQLDICVDNAIGHGLFLWDVKHCDLNNLFSADNSGSGLRLWRTGWFDLDYSRIERNGQYGVEMDLYDGYNNASGSCANITGAIHIENNKLGGVIGLHSSNIHLNRTSGVNGGFGLQLVDGSKATITGHTEITGKSGDASIDEGVTSLNWKKDFPNNGDKKSDTNTLCLISRREPDTKKQLKRTARSKTTEAASAPALRSSWGL